MRFRVATPDERRWIRDVLREHLRRALPRAPGAVSAARPRPRRLRPAAVRATASRSSPASRSSSRSTTLAAPLLLELQRAILERDAWPLLRVELPGPGRGFYDARARPPPRRRRRDLAYAEAKRADAIAAHPGARRTRTSWPAIDPERSRASPARRRADARGRR